MSTTLTLPGLADPRALQRSLARADIKSLLYLLVDVVIQFGVERHQRFIKEIYFDPERRRRSLAEAS